MPLLQEHEDDIEVALLVERNQGIDSDLVAAMQFESPEAAGWGSRQLEAEVISAVASLGSSVNVFSGFSREMMIRRGAVLAATAGVVLLLVLLFPRHAEVFFNRLLLGGRHYPTATNIDRILVNAAPVLVREQHDTQPAGTRSAQGLPLVFQVVGSGSAPERHEVWLASTESWQRRRLDLLEIPLEERHARLVTASERVEEAMTGGEIDVSAPWVEELTPLLAADAAGVLTDLHKATRDRTQLASAKAGLAKQLSAWPGEAKERHVFEGSLPRMVDPVQFKVYLRDGWTDPAEISMIPLPVVETALKPEPPAYARGAAEAEFDPAARQISVLEGSRVELSINCVNKPLKAAWFVVKDQEQARRWEMLPADESRKSWKLPINDTPLAEVRAPIRFEIQVTDDDELHLEAPIRGNIRLKADRRPTISAGLVLRVAVPTAKPEIEYRVNDDYGIASLALRVQVNRQGETYAPPPATEEPAGDVQPTETSAENSPTGPGASTEAEEKTLVIREAGSPLAGSALPLNGSYRLDLSPLALEKGDQLRLTLEATDYRGDTPGETAQSEPLILEISDESGVYAAILEADERSEQRLSEIIKRQLGIGDVP